MLSISLPYVHTNLIFKFVSNNKVAAQHLPSRCHVSVQGGRMTCTVCLMRHKNDEQRDLGAGDGSRGTTSPVRGGAWGISRLHTQIKKGGWGGGKNASGQWAHIQSREERLPQGYPWIFRWTGASQQERSQSRLFLQGAGAGFHSPEGRGFLIRTLPPQPAESTPFPWIGLIPFPAHSYVATRELCLCIRLFRRTSETVVRTSSCTPAVKAEEGVRHRQGRQGPLRCTLTPGG